MKKVVFFLIISVMVTGAVFAQSAESIFAAIPAAAYTKADDNATWTFAVTGLTISNSEGSITIPIRDMKNLSAITESGQPGISFGYDTAEHKRTYRIFANPLNGQVNIVITKDGATLEQQRLTRR